VLATEQMANQGLNGSPFVGAVYNSNLVLLHVEQQAYNSVQSEQFN